MQHLLLTFILLFTLSACTDNEEQATHNAKIIQDTKIQNDALLAQLKDKEEALKKANLETKAANEQLLIQAKLQKEALLKEQEKIAQLKKDASRDTKLSKTGILIENNVITIDTNKTKDFFKNIGNKLKEKLEKLTGQIEKGMIEEKDAGVQISESHINIDLNKTKDFLETWGKNMQGFIKEFDNIAKELDPK